MKGALCNIPIDVVDVCNTLPHLADSNGIVIVKLKKKLQYRSHDYFQSVRPNLILKFLQYLKLNNPLYYDIEADLDNIPSFLIDQKNQDSLAINVNNINIDDKILIIVERNDSRVEKVESEIHSMSSNLPISILFENCDDIQDGNSINTKKKHLEKVDITSNPI